MAFSTAITGLKASQIDLDVTGNNIANASTVGFKASRTEFGDIFSQVVVGAGSTNTAGNGVTVNDIAQDFTAGTIEFTNNNLDLAIDGTGFFQLKDSTGQSSYTRAGGFELDKDGFVVSKTGKFLQGYGLDALGNQEPIENLRVDQKESLPNSTDRMALSFNINSESDSTKLNHPYNPTDPSTYTFSTTQRSFDSLGVENTIKFDMVEWGPYRDLHTYTIDDSANTSGAFSTSSGNFAFGGVEITTANFPGLSPVPAAGDGAATLAQAIESAWSIDSSRFASLGINEIKRVGNNLDQVQVMFDADQGNVEPLTISASDDTVVSAATDLRFTAGAVEFASVNEADLAATSEGDTFQFAGATILLSGDETTIDDLVSLLRSNINTIRESNPDIVDIDASEDGTGIDIFFDPEAGQVDNVTLVDAGTNIFGFNGTGATTTLYEGDTDFRGLYQMYAYLNGDSNKLLDISGLSNDNVEEAPFSPGPIIIKFDPANGTLDEINGRTVANLEAVPGIYIKGADPTVVESDLPKEEKAILLSLTGTTQFASESIVKQFSQDGYTKGDLIGISFGEDGTMTASFSNGQVDKLGVVALATFENQGGLQPSGNTEWTVTLKSGQPILNPPGTGLNGSLRSSALEQSNVDLSEELVALIEAQRNFQANSKTLQTENSITQTILQIS